MLLLSTILLIDFFTIFVAAELTAVVNTTTGPVRGGILTTVHSVKYAVFAGMRYGKAPQGYLRFQPPVAADPWTEILNATTEGEHCIQFNFGTEVIEGAEDCLFINVFTPTVDLAETPTNLKSVIFWVYGGAFLHGSSFTSEERPDYFLEKDIVFVSLNYRAGIFGYLALGLANATGNAGLKDLVLGLKWVKENIEKFGGNPNNVTLLGASTGAAAVNYLVLSDAASGLFHGTISMSGTPLAPWAFQTPAKALSQAEKLANLMGITWGDKKSLLQAFYDASATDIVFATSKIATTFGPFTPTIEDESIAADVFLTDYPCAKYNSGRFNKVPHLLGYMGQETVDFVDSTQKIKELIELSFNEAEEYYFTLPPSIIAAKNRIDSEINFYEHLEYEALRQFVNDTSDLVYIGPVAETQKILASDNDNYPVYYYELSFYVPGPHVFASYNTLPGAGHGDDIPFIFYMPSRDYTDNPDAFRTIHRISTMWSNFAKYGNPTPDWVDNSINFTWPDSGSLGLCLKIGTELTVEPGRVFTTAKCLQNLTETISGGAKRLASWNHFMVIIVLLSHHIRSM